MATFNTAKLRKDILVFAARVILRKARSVCTSKTLKKDLKWELFKSNPHKARVFTDYYWARFFHDGRAAINRVTKRPRLVFFRKEDILLDPRHRLQGGYPREESQIRRFSDNASLKAEYRKFLKINKARAAKGQAPLMFVKKRVGRTEGNPFFTLSETPDTFQLIEDKTKQLFDQFFEDNVKNEKMTSTLHF